MDHLDLLKLDKWLVINKWLNNEEQEFFSTQLTNTEKKFLIDADQTEMGKFYDKEIKRMTKTSYYKDFNNVWCHD